MVTVIKPQPQTLSKPLTCNLPPAAPHDNAFDISTGLISSPMASDDMIKEYLDELHDDAEIGWSLDDHAMKGRVLDVEQKAGVGGEAGAEAGAGSWGWELGLEAGAGS
ncbi:hypothetical protein Tco_0788017 [Tanacetum coccineum]